MQTPDIKIRKGTIDDIEGIMTLYERAKQFMRATGNMNQWVGGYPRRENVLHDIEKGNNYIGFGPEGEMVMTFAFILGNDPTYNVIEEGVWLNDEPYGTIHRIASNGKYAGMMRQCVNYCFSKTNNLRIDTHEDNAPMLKALKELDFVRCGKIICQDGTPRIAFQKTKKKS